MRAKPKPTRNTFTPRLLVKQLAADVPGFKRETPQVQAALTSMVWIGATKMRQHTVHEGFMSFHYTELADQFGGQFKAINARLVFLDVKDTWRFDKDAKATDTFTKGYRFSPVVEESRKRFLAKKVAQKSGLIDASGTGIRTPPKPVASTDAAGVPTTRWRVANGGDSLSLVPVNIEALRFLRRYLAKKIATWESTGDAPRDLLMDYPSMDYLVELHEDTAKIIRMAHTDVAGLGNVMHRYVESDSGRLYATGGGSLQNAPELIRKAALSGLWDYDVENCHFDIVAQMARQAGFPCVAIENYMAHKKDVRAEIAKAVGISIRQTKTCLLALMYGARRSTWHENAIPQAIGEKAAALYPMPLFANIADEAAAARTAILKQHKLNRQGGLTNAFGKPLDTKSRKEQKDKPAKKAPTASQKLAHLVQGVEAKALRACIDLHPGEIVLVQHDGFTATKRLDLAALELAIRTATGYALRLEEKLVQPDLAEQLGKGVEREFSKVRNGRKTSKYADLSRMLSTKNTVNSAGSSLCLSPPPLPCLP